MKPNKKIVFGKRLTQFFLDMGEIYHFIRGSRVIIRNLSFRIVLFMMAAFFVINTSVQHKRAIIEEKNLRSLAEIFDNPELSDEGIELVGISMK